MEKRGKPDGKICTNSERERLEDDVKSPVLMVVKEEAMCEFL